MHTTGHVAAGGVDEATDLMRRKLRKSRSQKKKPRKTRIGIIFGTRRASNKEIVVRSGVGARLKKWRSQPVD